MSIVYYPNGSFKHVKNLGWLQRRITNVVSVDVRPISGTSAVYLSAHVDGLTFQCKFESARVLARWLGRPSLHRVSCYWINHLTTCDQVARYTFGT